MKGGEVGSRRPLDGPLSFWTRFGSFHGDRHKRVVSTSHLPRRMVDGKVQRIGRFPATNLGLSKVKFRSRLRMDNVLTPV